MLGLCAGSRMTYTACAAIMHVREAGNVSIVACKASLVLKIYISDRLRHAWKN